jgi:hypothetical protein
VCVCVCVAISYASKDNVLAYLPVQAWQLPSEVASESARHVSGSVDYPVGIVHDMVAVVHVANLDGVVVIAS